MGKPIELTTQRLRLRQWQDKDYLCLGEMNADADVMAYYPSVLTANQSTAMAKQFRCLIETRGWGFWVLEEKSSNDFVGFVGLHEPAFDLPMTPCVEIGWRLAKTHWRKGYATEAAQACLSFAFDHLQLDEVYSFTSLPNERSWLLMQRIGMSNTGEDFDHPMLPAGHSLSRHLSHKITKEQWQASTED